MLKIRSRAIAVHIVMQTGQYPTIKRDGFEFPEQEFTSEREREWESSYQTATGSLSEFNQLLKNLGDGQRAIRLHTKKGANHG